MDNITWNKLGQDVNAKSEETTEEKKIKLKLDDKVYEIDIVM